jgi:hypothetical protein
MMNARPRAHTKAPSFPVLPGFATRGRPFTPLSNLLKPTPAGGDPAPAGRGHDFGHVRVRAATPVKMSDCPPGMVRQADAGDGGTPAPTPADAGKKSQPTLALANDTYNDSETESHKKIKFDVTVPSDLTAKDYALVNHLKGFEKNGDGTFFKVKMYGNLVDFNFTSWQVDSVDEDPVYWSDSTARWNYTTTPGGFFATDDPGPALSSEKGRSTPSLQDRPLQAGRSADDDQRHDQCDRDRREALTYSVTVSDKGAFARASTAVRRAWARTSAAAPRAGTSRTGQHR